ncbi:hypothetical protein [Caballeronia sp. LZ035]|uniref:hypothetical protein n=1 Tax=Caballeronia sp. LZ035 TaxID=3038568 RepID=UPI002864EC00|nr:hypothetical protein [Caballeronia sp. LZ035]MDR5760648.1 hypothetical protein [Caballeronia sp. LZ035]
MEASRAESPIDEQIVIDAVRAWFRPHCDTARKQQSWQDVLNEAGLNCKDIDCFNRAIVALVHTPNRQLDIRCRCCNELGSDEGQLLEAIAQFQLFDMATAESALSSWFPKLCVARLATLIHWLASTLSNAGINIHSRARCVTYLQ